MIVAVATYGSPVPYRLLTNTTNTTEFIMSCEYSVIVTVVKKNESGGNINGAGEEVYCECIDEFDTEAEAIDYADNLS